MAYARFDDGALTHPKLCGLSDAAFATWVRGILYASLHLTDGFIPQSALPILRSRPKSCKELVDAGLWHLGTGGFWIRDYLQWNDERAKVLERKEVAKRRKDENRSPSGRESDAGWTANDSETDSDRTPTGSGVSPARGSAGASPAPAPAPDPEAALAAQARSQALHRQIEAAIRENPYWTRMDLETDLVSEEVLVNGRGRQPEHLLAAVRLGMVSVATLGLTKRRAAQKLIAYGRRAGQRDLDTWNAQSAAPSGVLEGAAVEELARRIVPPAPRPVVKTRPANDGEAADG